MTNTTRRPMSPESGTPPEPDAAPARPLGAGTSSSTHLARCGVCGNWLHVDEDELIASLDASPLCWNCGIRRPGAAPGPA